jgi:hypothetical protein
VGYFARWPLLLIDVTTEQGITGRSCLAPYLASVAAGDGVTLVADYNQGLALGDALKCCRALDDEGLTWIEEPLRYDDLALAGVAGLGQPGAGPALRGPGRDPARA